MGVADLRNAFNAVAQPRFTASKATLGYKQASGVQWQVLTFSGSSADGTAFTIQSEVIRPEGDVLEAARHTAQKLLDQ